MSFEQVKMGKIVTVIELELQLTCNASYSVIDTTMIQNEFALSFCKGLVFFMLLLSSIRKPPVHQKAKLLHFCQDKMFKIICLTNLQ